MQEAKVIERTDINSPSFSKHVSIRFTEDNDTPLQLISWNEEQGIHIIPLCFLNNHHLFISILYKMNRVIR